jgi:hypothetical protein
MKSLSTSLPVKAGAVLGFLTLAVVGWNLGDPPPENESVHSERKSRRGNRSKSTGPDALAMQRLAAIRAAGTPEARLRATLAVAGSLSPAEIASWLGGGWFDVKGGPERMIFRSVLLARWCESDPEGALAWSLKNSVKPEGAVISSLAANEPERLIDFFKKHPHEAAELEALQAVAGTRPDLALDRLREIATAAKSQDLRSEFSGVLLQLAETSPAGLEAALGTLPPRWRTEAEAALCGRRLATSFSAEVRTLENLPGGLNRFINSLRQDPDLKEKLWDGLADLPPMWREEISDSSSYIRREDTGKVLDADLAGHGFTPRQAEKLRENALELMAWYDPEDALTRMAGMELSASQRQSLIDRMFRRLGRDQNRAEGLIVRLDSEEQRERARETLISGRAELIRRFGGSSEIKAVDPTEWLEQIGGIDPQDTAGSAPYLHQMAEWSPDKHAALGRQFEALPDDRKKQVAQMISRSGGNSPVTGDAIRYLLANPEARPDGRNGDEVDPVRMASQYATQLAARNPAAAGEWAESLPAGTAKLWAQINVARNWAVYDPKAAGQWVESLPANARGEVRALLNKKK